MPEINPPIQSDVIFIIGGGPSARGLNFESLKGKGYILGVNDSFLHAPCDGVVSMDGRWMFNRCQQLRDSRIPYFAAYKHFMKWCGAIGPWAEVELYHVDPYKDPAHQGMNESFEPLWANNSGFMAMNIAYLCRPKQIYLFGFDLRVNPKEGENGEHWYGQYEWREFRNRPGLYNMWLPHHKVAARQFRYAGIKVFNVSRISRIPCYGKIPFETIDHHIGRIQASERGTPRGTPRLREGRGQ